MTERVSIDAMMKQALEIPGLLSLAAGFTDNAVMPRAEIRDIVDALFADDSNNELLQYGDPSGRRELRALLAARLTEADRVHVPDAPAVNPDHVVVTNGSQQALFLAIQSMCRPGDVVLVEEPTYFVFLDLLKTLGVHAVALPARDSTLYVEALGEFFATLEAEGTLSSVRAVYLVSYFSNPSALSLTTRQKNALLDAMTNAGLKVPVIEDVAYRDFYFDEEWPAASLLPRASKEIPILLTGTLTKIFATGLKVGYAVVEDDAVRRRLLDLKRCADFGTPHFNQGIIERAIADGHLDAFLVRLRREYSEKCEALDQALRDGGLEELGWTWRRSAGSLYLWLSSPDGLVTSSGSPFSNACMDEKVIYVPGDLCFVSGGTDKVRLSFGALSLDELREAGARFVRAAERFKR